MALNENPRITPDDVEMVRYSDLADGDILVGFTPKYRDIVIAPTQRQLSLKTTTYHTVTGLHAGTTPRGVDILIHDGYDGYDAMAVPECAVWRMKRK